jgi:predicted nucleotidyltransferase component of viral defense system
VVFGSSGVSTFSREEVLATKLRALLQRDKGRDLLDLADAIDVFPNLDRARLVGNFGRYLRKSGLSISRAEAERRMFGKLRNPRFLKDVRPLLSEDGRPS